MKLKKINPKTSRKGKMTLSFNSAGSINFSKRFMELIGERRSFDFMQDEESPADWYLHFHDEGSLKIKAKSSQGFTNCVSVYREICKSTHNDSQETLTAKLVKPISHEGIELFPLLIKKRNHHF